MLLSKYRAKISFHSPIFTSLLFAAMGLISSPSVQAEVTYPTPVAPSQLKLPIPFKNCAEMQKYFNTQAYKNKEDVSYQGFEKHDMNASFFEYHSGRNEETFCTEGFIIRRNLLGTRVCIGSLLASSVFNGNFSSNAYIGTLDYTGKIKKGNSTCRWRD